MRTKRLYVPLSASPVGLVNDIRTPVKWTPDALLLSPLIEYVDGFSFLTFGNIDVQQTFANITVPSNYTPGTQIFMRRGIAVSLSTAKNVLMRASTTLIEGGTTILGTYTNIYNSTNAEILLGASNEFSSLGDIDLTNAAGQINGVAVAPGDYLRIKLTRNFAGESAPALNPVRILDNSFMVFFN